MTSKIEHKILSPGPLRLGLYVLAVIEILVPVIGFLTSSSGTVSKFSGWEIFSGLIAPVIAPLLVVVLFIDFVMSRILATDETESLRGRYLAISRIELLIIGLMFAFWVPYFLAL